jgi:hypothetical protein
LYVACLQNLLLCPFHLVVEVTTAAQQYFLKVHLHDGTYRMLQTDADDNCDTIIVRLLATLRQGHIDGCVGLTPSVCVLNFDHAEPLLSL